MTGTSRTIRRWIIGVLCLQIALAVILMGSDVIEAIPEALSPSRAPALVDPVAPGDQTRRFDPERIPRRGPATDTRPVPERQDMPRRLTIQQDDIEGRTRMTLSGAIAPGDGRRLRDHFEINGPPEVVFFNSPGGSVEDALTIGRDIRARGIETAMMSTHICLSACPYSLVGGVTRSIAPGALIGVHQHVFGENVALPAFLAVEDIQRGQGEVMRFLVEMGIDPAIMIPALLTPPDEIYILVEEEIRQYQVSNSDENGEGTTN